MMRRLLISILLVCFFVGGKVYSQNIWGAEAATGQLAGQFDGNFIETGVADSYDPSSWTALSVFDSDGVVTPGSAYFTKSFTGETQGGFGGGTPILNSPSLNNGVAIFDSDFLDNAGNPSTQGGGSSPALHRGELISPRIDLQNYVGESLALKAYLGYRTFDGIELSIAFSVDDGVTWSQSVNISDSYAVNVIVDPDWFTMEIPNSVFDGVVNLTQFRFKFNAQMNYYYFYVDDVTLMVSDLIFASDFD
ncbi:hypothetical protein [Marinicella sp. W31]|uniref:hypothetical protein n=1 Tax=Marinicella sp. W31 TaxID=3023713 RepID=UPI00375773CE